MPTTTPSLSTLRRLAARTGLRVTKIDRRSRHFWEYGPYALVDTNTNAITLRRLDLKQVAEHLAIPNEE